VGVLVQTNFGGILQINGAPVGEELGKYYLKETLETKQDGSCMIIVATDAPLEARQLKRLARRALYGLVRAGGISTHGSGDYVIAFSTAKEGLYFSPLRRQLKKRFIIPCLRRKT
jgi:D-aminopeptidase